MGKIITVLDKYGKTQYVNTLEIKKVRRHVRGTANSILHMNRGLVQIKLQDTFEDVVAKMAGAGFVQTLQYGGDVYLSAEDILAFSDNGTNTTVVYHSGFNERVDGTAAAFKALVDAALPTGGEGGGNAAKYIEQSYTVGQAGVKAILRTALGDIGGTVMGVTVLDDADDVILVPVRIAVDTDATAVEVDLTGIDTDVRVLIY